MLFTIAVLSLWCAMPADAAVDNEGQAVRSIYMEVPAGEDPVQLKSVISLHEGDAYSKLQVSRSIKLLYNLGRFSNVQALLSQVDGGGAVTFRLLPKILINSVSFEGNDALDDTQLRSALKIVEGDAYVERVAHRQREEVLYEYLEEGFAKVRVSMQTKSYPGEPKVDITYIINEGPRTEISNILLNGELLFPVRKILTKMELSTGDDVSLTEIKNGIRRVKQFYFSQGYYEATVDFVGPEGRKGSQTDRELPIYVWQNWELLSEGKLALNIDPGQKISFIFSGNRYFSDKHLRSVIAFDSSAYLGLSGQVLRQLTEKLHLFYLRMGYLHNTVSFTVTHVSEGNARYITFHIEEGTRVKIREVTFTGNHIVSSDDLEDQLEARLYQELEPPEPGEATPPRQGLMETKGSAMEWRHAMNYPAGAYRRLRRSADPDYLEAYMPSLYEEIITEHLTIYYQTRGFLKVQIGLPELTFNKRGERVIVTFPVTEGPQSIITSIDITGANASDRKELLDVIELQEGMPLNKYAYRQWRRALRKHYAAKGYLYAQIFIDEKLSDDLESAKLHINIVEGPKVRVRGIVVKGNTYTRKAVIIDRLVFEPGEVYTPEKARLSEEFLLRLGVLQTATVALFDEERVEEYKTVIISLIERPSGDIEFGGGFSTDEGVRARFNFVYRNLFNVALELHLKAALNYTVPQLVSDAFVEVHDDTKFIDWLERNITVGLRYPSIYGVPFRMGVGFDVNHVRLQEPSYGMDKNALLTYVDTEIGKQITISALLELSHIDLRLTHIPLSGTERFEQSEGTTLQISPQLSFIGNWVDDLFVPTRGARLSLSTAYYQDLANELDSSLLRNRLLLTGYIPIPMPWMRGRYIVIKVQGRLGYIHNFISASVTEEKRFFIGGRLSMRGWDEQSIYPEDLSDEQIAQIRSDEIPSPGGLSYLVFKGELRVPVYKQYSLGAFFDVGQLWQDPKNMHLDFSSYLASAGVGAHYSTPIGEINFDVGWQLKEDARFKNDGWAVHFSIGFF